ncbi:hypothetical protein DXU04_35680 [Bradyrhizobium diazoefficiens]|jgi:hypothetical protein
MLTRQHRLPKDRENLPSHEQASGELTSVPASGNGDDPHAIAHRGDTIAAVGALRSARCDPHREAPRPPDDQDVPTDSDIACSLDDACRNGRRRTMSRGRPLLSTIIKLEGMT